MDAVTIAIVSCYAIFIPITLWGLATTFYDSGYREYKPVRLISEPATIMICVAMVIPFVPMFAASGIWIYRAVDRKRQNGFRRLYALQVSEKLDGLDNYIEQVRQRRIEELEYQTGVRPYRSSGIARKI